MSSIDTPYPLSDEQVAQYQRDGFIQISNVIDGDDLKRLREAVVAAVTAENAPRPADQTKSPYEQIFIQKVNLWRRWPAGKEFVMCRRFGDLGGRFCGQPGGGWHDQAPVKKPRHGGKTPR